MAPSADLAITQLPVISGGGYSRTFFVPANKLIVIDQATFVRLDKCATTTFGVMGCGRRGHVHFNIIDILVTLRNAAMFAHADLHTGRGCDEADSAMVNLIHPSDGNTTRQKKRNLRGLLPEVLTIIAPSIDGGDGFTMRVACPYRITSPVAVELTTDNIRYLRAAAREWPDPPPQVRRRVHLQGGVVHHKGVVRDARNQRLLCRVQVTPDRKRTKVFNFSKFDSETDAATRAAEFMSRVPPTIIEVDSPTQPTDSSEPPVES